MNHSFEALPLLFSILLSTQALANTPLRAETPLELPGKPARFDFMKIDSVHQRLLAAHKGAGVLTVVDLKTGKLLSEIPVGHVQGIAVADRLATYAIGDADEHQVVFVNAKTLAINGALDVNGPVDAIAFDSKNGLAYADEDDGSRVWVIDVLQRKLVATVSVPGEPEDLSYDRETNRVYQNVKTKDSLVVIDPATQKLGPQWSTLPATGPHGLVIDSKTGRAFVAGHNGKLVAIDVKSGKVVAQTDIAPGTDQIAFDPTDRIIYCASKGFISEVKETATGLQSLGDTPDHMGAHTIAVDSRRHQIWISYADKEHSYLQRFGR